LKSNKKPVFASKSLEKVWKVWKKDQKMFGKSSEKVWKFRKLGISELSENYEK
jgi:hypothetical protein